MQLHTFAWFFINYYFLNYINEKLTENYVFPLNRNNAPDWEDSGILTEIKLE